MRRSFLIFYLFLLIIIQHIHAQKIDYKNIDYPYLEHLIEIGINGLRAEKKLSPLSNDSILYLAAENHSSYLLKTNNTGHTQPENPEWETPHKRILYYGGKYLSTAENVAKTYLFLPVSDPKKPYNTEMLRDYQSVAKSLAEGWKNSPGHYKNIINPEFNITGVSVSYNKQTQALYAVQTFGKTKSATKSKEKIVEYTNKKNEKQYTKPNPHRKHAWNIKSGEKIKNSRLFDNFIKQLKTKNIRMFVEKDSVKIQFASYNEIRNLFRNKKDGLTLEFIPFSHYTNDSIYYTRPSRRNNACIFNGTVIKPIYKEQLYQLISQQQKNRKNKTLVINFGKIPETISDSLFEINLVFLNDNCIQYILPFYKKSGGFLFYPIQADTIPFHFQVRDVKINFKPDYDTLIYKIYFERNETKIDDSTAHLLISKLDAKNYKPYFGILTSYASVEGPEEKNKTLYQKRAQNLINIIKKEYADTFHLFVHTKENWDLFKKQLYNTKYDFLKDTSSEFVKRFLSLDQPLKDLDSRLDKQRYVNLYLIKEEILTEEKQIQYAISQYKEIYNRIEKRFEKGKQFISKVEKEKLSDLEHYIFARIAEDKLNQKILDSLPTLFPYKDTYNDKDKFRQLEYDRVKFYISHNKDLSLSNKYMLLSWLIEKKDPELFPAFNYFIMTIDNRYREQLVNSDRIDKSFLIDLKTNLDKFNPDDTTVVVDDIKLFYHIATLILNYIEDPTSDFSKYNNSLRVVYRYFSDTTLSETYRFQAAKFLILFDADQYALNILSDLYKTTQNKEIIRTFLILYYSRPEFNITDTFHFLFEYADKWDNEEWCKLFTEKVRINFQILDYEIIRDLFCEKCIENNNH